MVPQINRAVADLMPPVGNCQPKDAGRGRQQGARPEDPSRNQQNLGGKGRGQENKEPGRRTSDRNKQNPGPDDAQRKRAVPETPTEPINLLLPSTSVPQPSRIRSHGKMGGAQVWSEPSGCSLPDEDWGPPVYSPQANRLIRVLETWVPHSGQRSYKYAKKKRRTPESARGHWTGIGDPRRQFSTGWCKEAHAHSLTSLPQPPTLIFRRGPGTRRSKWHKQVEPGSLFLSIILLCREPGSVSDMADSSTR